MIIKTEDPTTWITNKTEELIEYENIDGKKWIIYGKCNACGLCEIYDESLIIDNITTQTNIKMVNNEIILWQRQLLWKNKPGVPGACEEINYSSRKDIPIIPDLVNSIKECALSGEWK